MTVFPAQPATIIFESEKQFGIFQTVEIIAGDPDNSPFALVGSSRAGSRKFALASWEKTADNYWKAKSSPGGVGVVIRPTVETDVLNSITVQADFPLPLDVISALTEPVFNMPTLYAVSEDDGFVATMMLSSDTGMYMRYSGQWHTLVPDVVDGLTVTEVMGNALDMFDQFDRAGQAVNVSAMPKAANELPRSVGTGNDVPETVMASAAVLVEVPVMVKDDPDSIQAAVDLANEHPEMRWYVERRLKAYGVDVEVPW